MNEQTGSLLTYALNKNHFLRQQVHRLCQRTQGSTEEGEGLNDGERHINIANASLSSGRKKKRKKIYIYIKDGRKLAGKRNECKSILRV